MKYLYFVNFSYKKKRNVFPNGNIFNERKDKIDSIGKIKSLENQIANEIKKKQVIIMNFILIKKLNG